jgi:transposase
MNSGAIGRCGPGRPRLRPKRVAADKAYSSRYIRQSLRRWRVRVTIPRRSDERPRGRFDRTLYRCRNRVERLIGRLKQSRRLATRYEKRARNHRAMWLIGCILLWL